MLTICRRPFLRATRRRATKGRAEIARPQLFATQATSSMCTGKGARIYAFPQPYLVLAVVAVLVVVMAMGVSASAQDNDDTVGEFWLQAEAHIQFPKDWRLLGFVGLKKGEDFPYQQIYAGFGLGYQWKQITKPHLENIDPDKEHTFVFGGGYERLQTLNSGKTSDENRLAHSFGRLRGFCCQTATESSFAGSTASTRPDTEIWRKANMTSRCMAFDSPHMDQRRSFMTGRRVPGTRSGTRLGLNGPTNAF